jgi:hypothetical protein
MALILKLIGLVASVLTTIFLIVEGVRGGLLIISTIFGIVKIIVILTFLALLLIIFYLLLTSDRRPSPEES